MVDEAQPLVHHTNDATNDDAHTRITQQCWCTARRPQWFNNAARLWFTCIFVEEYAALCMWFSAMLVVIPGFINATTLPPFYTVWFAFSCIVWFVDFGTGMLLNCRRRSQCPNCSDATRQSYLDVAVALRVAVIAAKVALLAYLDGERPPEGDDDLHFWLHAHAWLLAITASGSAGWGIVSACQAHGNWLRDVEKAAQLEGARRRELAFRDAWQCATRVAKWTATGRATDERCAICYMAFAVDEPVRVLPCAHRFHVPCFAPWAESRHALRVVVSCPLCIRAVV